MTFWIVLAAAAVALLAGFVATILRTQARFGAGQRAATGRDRGDGGGTTAGGGDGGSGGCDGGSSCG
ncbi:hypothetical protein [Luteimonas sp. SDU101]|uniref:hypothetical protein n=1 Tax=unclassified Luteimonas TaxID=2629088 RepID=UPI003EB7E186